MKLNKNSSYVLLSILAGNQKSAQISQHLKSVDIRTIQRSLSSLTDLELVKRSGSHNNPLYTPNYSKILQAKIPEKLLEDESRPSSSFNADLLAWLQGLSPLALNGLLSDLMATGKPRKYQKMTAKELEYLTIELSWKSSALEGNTYTLLDTQLLILEGVKAKNRTKFETQMILNHKNSMSFIIANSELFGDNIKFSTIDELHKIISFNLGINTGIRKRIVKISASNYTPMSNPHQLRESIDDILDLINIASSPLTKAVLAFALVPYLQAFEDGNKRTGRMFANAILINFLGSGFSLRGVDARALALAYLSFYEFNSLEALSSILSSQVKAD